MRLADRRLFGVVTIKGVKGEWDPWQSDKWSCNLKKVRVFDL